MIIGATGKFPRGKLCEDDEGELMIAIGTKGDVVVLDFGKPIAWLALPFSHAKRLSEMLSEYADLLESKTVENSEQI